MSGETVNVKITLRGVDVWHKGAFVKRWKHWEYVLGIAVDVIILDYELEEWICYSFGMQLGADKPFKALSDKCKEKRGSKGGYKKWQLPRFVENLDFNTLRRNCHSFEDFASILLSGK
jgi:hypothetical protein